MPKKHSLRDINGANVHPYSRRATQIHRSLKRAEKLDKQKASVNAMKRTPEVERMLWFKYAMDPESISLSKEEIHDLIHSYIDRNDNEINTLEMKKNRSVHGSHSNRLSYLQLLKEKDLDEYKTGFSMPDLTDAKNVEALQEWNGDFNSRKLIRIIRMTKE